MENNSLFTPKAKEESLTGGLAPDIRREAERIAKENNTTLTKVIEAGLSLLFDKIKSQKKES